jgi:hypothetical protein
MKLQDVNAKVEWYKVDKNNNITTLISKNRESIVITPITSNDLGRYRCKAINLHGYRYRDAILTRNIENNIDIFIYGFVNDEKNEPSHFDFYHFNVYNGITNAASTYEPIDLNKIYENSSKPSLLNVKKMGKLRVNTSIDLKCYSSKFGYLNNFIVFNYYHYYF